MLKGLYKNKAGRIVLKGITTPTISKFVGKVFDTRFSVLFIPIFIWIYHIDLSEIKKDDWTSFNHFFKRNLTEGSRPVDPDKNALISPCDGFIKVFPIENDTVVTVKDSRYTISDLVKNERLAEAFEGGKILIIRLMPSHYHRYAYPTDGTKSRDINIPGVLHTVRPVATHATDVYVQNSRTFSVLKTENFGRMIFMQVGALCVGKISNNNPGEGSVIKGDDAGTFEYGGSTIILIVKKDKVDILPEITTCSEKGEEYPIKMGERVGVKFGSSI